MCGIAGLWDRRASSDEATLRNLAGLMIDPIAHRGPDSSGVWVDPEAGIGFGHLRLAIVDLSPAGYQPMISASGRTVITYNGEVYNAAELRPELEARGIRFRGHSDTEVMIEACEAWGVDVAVKRFIGMFAFALWDRKERRLTMVRDRLGIKPLYWGTAGDVTLFGSQPKAIAAHPAWEKRLDQVALREYLRFGYVPAPQAIYEGMRQLEPGCLIEIDAAGRIAERRYWDMAEVAARGIAGRRDDDEKALADELETLLRSAIRLRMIADVPLGAFLSGGIDSSTVVALMQAESNRPIKTFSIGFHEGSHDEAVHAKAVAAHLGTEHRELYLSPAEAREIIPSLPDWYDEPFADSSQIPTHLVSRLARQEVTVALSGDGGDELFAGYTRYTTGPMLWRRSTSLPAPLRHMAAAGIRAVPPAAWDCLAALLPASVRPPQMGRRAHKLAAMIGAPDLDTLYRSFISMWHDPEAAMRRRDLPPGPVWRRAVPDVVTDPVERMQFLDTITYLPDDILAKVDRATMAIGLEARVPLIDHRVVEFAWSLPPALKGATGPGKRLLRQVLYRHVPPALVERPKMGFAVPVGAWLAGPLRDWTESLIGADRLRREGIFDPAPIRRIWDEHRSGRRNHEAQLWSILMFQAWQERWMGA
jgi:asparagine synthase (glutamine-hydrolysing)